MTYHTCSAQTAKSCHVKILYIHLPPHIFIYFHTHTQGVVGMTLESPGTGKKAMINSEHSENSVYFRCSICIETSHALPDMFCKPGLTAVSRQWWPCSYPDRQGALGAPLGLGHPRHPACHRLLRVPSPLWPRSCGSTAASEASSVFDLLCYG